MAINTDIIERKFFIAETLYAHHPQSLAVYRHSLEIERQAKFHSVWGDSQTAFSYELHARDMRNTAHEMYLDERLLSSFDKQQKREWSLLFVAGIIMGAAALALLSAHYYALSGLPQ